MKNKIFDIIRLIILIVLVIYMHIGSLLIALNKISILKFSQILHIIGIISFITYTLYKIMYRKKIEKYDIIILTLVFFAIISTIYAYNTEVALIGTYNRHEGLYSILSYYSFFLLSTTINPKYQRIIMNIIIFFGLFQIAIGTIQTLRITNILGYDRSNNLSTKYYYASGTLINPNFYSTYILICTLYILGNLFKSTNLKIKILYSILLSIYIYGLIIGNTLSSILTFILVSLIALCFNIKLKKIKKNIFLIFIIIGLSLSALIIVDKHKYNTLYKTMRNNLYEVINIFKYGIKDTTGNSRIYVWRITIKKLPENLLTGIGIDNFIYIDKGNAIITDVKGRTLAFDKAHNDYLQILITEGIFALITYLSLIFFILYIAIKNNLKNKNYGLQLSFIGYIIQMFIVFSVIVVAPVFYIIMGFIIGNKELKE